MYDYNEGREAIHVFLGTGSSSYNYQWWQEENRTGHYYADNVSKRFLAGDYNGDGKDDVIAYYQYWTGIKGRHLFVSTASSFNNGIDW